MATPKPQEGSSRASRARWLGLGALSSALVVSLLVAAAAPARGEGAADPASVLEKLREQSKLRQEQEEREFRRLIEQGRTLLAEHATDQAKRVLAQAAKVRPGDEACMRLLAQCEVSAAPAAASSGKLLAQIKEERGNKSAMLHVQLEASLFEADKALKAGDCTRAREHAERVLDSVAYVTEADRASKLRSRAEGIVSAAEAAGEKAKATELQSVLATRKQQAAQDKSGSIASLNREGWQHLDQGDAEKALAVAEEMLRLEPGSRQGIYLRDKAREVVGSRSDIPALRSHREEAAKKLLVDQLNEEMTVPADVKERIVLPGKRHPKDFLARGERGIEPWEQELRAKLREPIEVEFKGATIADACKYLSQTSDCTMVMDTTVLNDTKRLSLPKMTVSLEHALRWVCRLGKVTYTLSDHAILVTARGGLLDQPLTKDYDVSGLLIPTRCIRTAFNGGTHTDDQSWGAKGMVSGGASAAKEETKVVAEDVQGDSWVRFIRSTVAPETWEEPGQEAVQQQQQPYTISYRNGRIVVVHVPEVQEQIEHLLNDFRKARNLQVHILARFLIVQMDFLEKYDLDLVGQGFSLATDDLGLGPGTSAASAYGYVSEPADLWQTGVNPPKKSTIAYLYNDSMVATGSGLSASEPGPLSIRCAHVGSHTCNALLQAVVKHRKGTILTAPRLTCFNTQRANFQAITNYNYIRSLNADGEPEIGNVPDGMIFDVQPFVSSDRRYITLVLQPQMRTLLNRATLQSTGLAYAQSGAVVYRQVNLPDTELRSVATTVTIPDGGTMLVGGLARVREASGQASVPILHDIPLLRYIFREWMQTNSRESLLVLVTAEIVPDIFEE